MKHFIALKDFSRSEVEYLLSLSLKVKKKPSVFAKAARGACIGLLFEKPSLRTKTAFYVGALGLGANVIYYTPQEIKLGERETVSDVAKTLASLLDAVVLRTFSHNTVMEFSRFSAIPVINGLSDLLHPSQALADAMTIIETRGALKNVKIGYIGDGNNVCHSLMYITAILGGTIFVATPPGYEPATNIVEEVKSIAAGSQAEIKVTHDALEAAKGAAVLYTDVWVSMGSGDDQAERKKAFKNFQINDTIVSKAESNALVMHCLPAHRGEEITDSVIDGKNSVVFRQAENRLHTAKAVLFYLLKSKK